MPSESSEADREKPPDIFDVALVVSVMMEVDREMPGGELGDARPILVPTPSTARDPAGDNPSGGRNGKTTSSLSITPGDASVLYSRAAMI